MMPQNHNHNRMERRESLHFRGRVFGGSHPGSVLKPAAKLLIDLEAWVGGGTWRKEEEEEDTEGHSEVTRSSEREWAGPMLLIDPAPCPPKVSRCH